MLSHLLGSVTLGLLSCASCTDDTGSAPDTDDPAVNCSVSPAGDPAIVLSSAPPTIVKFSQGTG